MYMCVYIAMENSHSEIFNFLAPMQLMCNKDESERVCLNKTNKSMLVVCATAGTDIANNIH